MTPPAAASPLPESRWRSRVVVLTVLGGLLLFGAWQLAFLCDDAFITFRYVSNAVDGRGLVWNPAPFQPVEGYTGFLWAVVLWAVWSWFGIEPPDSANVLSIACGLALFTVIAAAAFRLRDRAGRRAPDVVVYCTLAAIVANRTFLQWMTSGLETSLFNLAFVSWCVLGFRVQERRTTRWLGLWSAAAAATALTRPDGLLLASATAATAAVALVQRQFRMRQLWLGLSPLLGVVAHVAWRRWFYGEWVPNTYFAKVGAPWPESGLRYLVTFAVENGVWIWLPFACVWLVVELRRGLFVVRQALVANVPAIAVVVVPVVLCGYYVWRVGGDHFEYRIFSHLVPLGGLATAGMALRVRAGLALPITMVLSIGLASAVAWLLAAIQPVTLYLYRPVSPHLPDWVQPLSRWYDGQRAWLSMQAVGTRCDQHRICLQFLVDVVPPRTRRPFDPEDIPVHIAFCAGRVGWAFPDIAVIDALGLNDWVVARTLPDRDHAAADATPQEAAIAAADVDGDTWISHEELTTALAGVPGGDKGIAGQFSEQLFMIFAAAERGTLSSAQVPAIIAFLRGWRRMAHERYPPPGYIEAFDANVTIEDRQMVLRPRSEPLPAAKVRAIEAEWRQRLRPPAPPAAAGG